MVKVTNESLLTQVVLVKDGDGSKAVSIAPGETDDLDLFTRDADAVTVLERMGALSIEGGSEPSAAPQPQPQPQPLSTLKPNASIAQPIGTTQTNGPGTAAQN